MFLRMIGGFTTAAVLCLAITGTTLATSRGNATTAKACQRGGWALLQNGSGGTFQNMDECVEYGAGGGSVFKPSFTFDPTHVPLNTDAHLHVTGFHSNSTGTLTQHVLGGSGATFSFLNVPLDGNGNMAVIGTAFTGSSCTDGVTGSEWTFVDAQGLHAGATVTLDCN